MNPETPVDYLTVDSSPDQVKAAIQQTTRILEQQGVANPEAVATSKAATRTGRFIPQPQSPAQEDPWSQQFGQMLLKVQAEDEAAEKEAQSGVAG